jgi:hypothetical protein
VAYTEGTPEREAQKAQEAFFATAEQLARISGTVPDGAYVQDFVVIGVAAPPEGGETSVFIVPGTNMRTDQLHGLLSYADDALLSGLLDPDDEGEDG